MNKSELKLYNKKIQKMLQNKKISQEQATKLIESLENNNGDFNEPNLDNEQLELINAIKKESQQQKKKILKSSIILGIVSTILIFAFSFIYTSFQTKLYRINQKISFNKKDYGKFKKINLFKKVATEIKLKNKKDYNEIFNRLIFRVDKFTNKIHFSFIISSNDLKRAKKILESYSKYYIIHYKAQNILLKSIDNAIPQKPFYPNSTIRGNIFISIFYGFVIFLVVFIFRHIIK